MRNARIDRRGGARFNGGRWRRFVTLAVLVSVAGCTMPRSGRVADAWHLVGPFVRLHRGGDSPRRSWANGAPPRTSRVAVDSSSSGFSQPSRERPSSRQEPGGAATRLRVLPLGKVRVSALGESSEPPTDVPRHHLFAPDDVRDDRFWYLDLGFRMGVTRLHETQHRLDRRLDLPRKVDVLGVFKSPQTPIDRKTELGLTTSYIGIGRRETEWLTWNFYFGTGVGGDRDHQRWLTANQEVNFDYGIWYTGLTVDVYPWGLSQRGRYENWKEHLRASRPYFVSGFEMGYVRARGWGHFAIAPVKLYRDSQRVEDWLFSYLLGFGWEIPLDERWAFNLQVHYTFHFYRPEEYNSWNVTYALRYQF